MQGKIEFFVKQSSRNMNLYLGIVMLLVGLFGIFALGMMGIFVGVGIVFIFMSFWQNKPIITLHEDYFEMKAAPAAPKRMILYTDIETLSRESDKKCHIKTRDGKKVILPVHLLVKEDMIKLIDLINGKIGH